jgi:AraC-like DNA-binding protein
MERGSLARAVGAPRTTFNRRFVKLTGQAPMAYVTSWRMSVASRLLREERHPLREIAHRVGYDPAAGKVSTRGWVVLICRGTELSWFRH